MNLRDTLYISPQGQLTIGGIAASQLAKQYGTPLYVMDEAYIRSVVRAFRDTIGTHYGAGNMAFASKAFSCKAIYRIMQEEGACIDVVSGGEIYTAKQAGFDMSRAYFHGNNKLESEIELALDCGVGTFVVDSYDEMQILNEMCKSRGMRQKCLVRINPGVEAHTHTFVQTATVDSKFGFSVRNGEALRAIRKLVSYENLDFAGVHSHIGSQIFDKSAFVLAVDVVTDFVQQLEQAHNIPVREINLGGGFAVHYTQEDPCYNVQEYCNYVRALTDALQQAVEKKNITRPYFMIEPGRSIVGEAGITLYTVGARKEIPDVRTYIAIDGGMFENIRPALYDSRYEVVLADRANEPAAETVSVAGKCCESGDILYKDVRLPKANRGDILAAFTTGAYGYAMSNNYNRNLTPAVVFVRDGQSYVAVRRQTLDDLVRNDV